MAAVDSLCAKQWISSHLSPASTAVPMAPSAQELTALIGTLQAMRPTGYWGRSDQGEAPGSTSNIRPLTMSRSVHCVTSANGNRKLRLEIKCFGKHNSFHLQS
jgi:hypothetical protein